MRLLFDDLDPECLMGQHVWKVLVWVEGQSFSSARN